jgi:archaetidylinositol phosphate synthase
MLNMVLYKHRERFEDLSIKVGILFSKARLSPNHWTLLSLLPVSGALYYLSQGLFLPAALLFLATAFIDLVDGSVARVTGRVSKLGAYLDTVVDRYVEFIVILGVLLAGIPGFLLPSSLWVLLYLFGAMMTTYSKAAAKEKGLVSSEIRGGIFERAERLIVLFAGLVLASFNPIYLTYVVILLAFATNLTALHRIGISISKVKE